MADVVFYEEGSSTPHSGDLDDGTTYYAEIQFGSPTRLYGLSSMQWIWDAAIVVTGITYETTNLWSDEAPVGGVAGADWYPDGPSAVVVAGGSASTVVQHLADNGAARMRAKVVVGGTGGALRGVPYGKDS